MFSNHSIHTVITLLLSSIGQVQQVHAQNRNWNGRATPVTCSICGDANRPILNPTQSFTMNNGITWTCDYLQETVQDVDPNASYENERMMCIQAQLEGKKGGCQCGFASTTIDNIQFPVPESPDVIPVATSSPVAVPILLPTPSPVTIPVPVPPTPSPVLSSLAETTTPTPTFQPTTPFPPTEQSPFSAPTPSLITESTGITSAPSRRVVSSSNRPSARGGSSNSSTRSGRPSSSGSDKGSGKSGSGKSGGKSGSGKSGKSSSSSSASGSSRRSNGGAADNDEVLLKSSEYAFVSSSPTTTSYTTIVMIALVSSAVAAFLL
mmetsp:Transcript_64264/g.71974  ORF Transcript_64264/g.71974 Transcript_64264/m.71974 type:complete len:321 (+) Transcript_64264:80-1042(+)